MSITDFAQRSYRAALMTQDQQGGRPDDRTALARPDFELASPPDTFYGRVLRNLGDARFSVLVLPQAREVQCTVTGRMRQTHGLKHNWISAEDIVLVAMRQYESDTQHHRMSGDIVLKYDRHQVIRLQNAGLLVLPEAQSDGSNVEFVDMPDIQTQFDGGAAAADSGDLPEGDQQDEQVRRAVMAAADRGREEDLPSPAIRNRSNSRNRSRKSSPAPVLDVDFHHPVDFHPGVSTAAAGPAAAPRPPPPPSHFVTIDARFVFWNEKEGFGYAKPVDNTQTKVRLFVWIVSALKCDA
jgi:translation initiation factor IF-1